MSPPKRPLDEPPGGRSRWATPTEAASTSTSINPPPPPGGTSRWATVPATTASSSTSAPPPPDTTTSPHKKHKSSTTLPPSPGSCLNDWTSTHLPSGQLSALLWPTPTPTTTTASKPLGFGVEIETTLAFHQSHITHLLPDHPDHSNASKNPWNQTLVKSLNPAQRKALANKRHTDELSAATRPGGYQQAWAVTYDEREVAADGAAMMGGLVPTCETWTETTAVNAIENTVEKGKKRIRAYWPEPLKIVQGLFERKRSAEIAKGDDGDDVWKDLDIVSNLGKVDDKSWYKTWTAVNDNTLVAAPRGTLKGILEHEGLVKNADEVAKWDNTGIEIVSRVLRAENVESLVEIQKVMDILVSKEEGRHWAFYSPFAAVHVHVGFNAYLDFDKNVVAQQEEIAWSEYQREKSENAAKALDRGTAGSARGRQTGPEKSAEGIVRDVLVKKMTRLREPKITELLPVLRHLAYIVLIFEDVFKSLFPKHLRGLAGSLSAGDCRSNRETVYNMLTLYFGSDFDLEHAAQVIFGKTSPSEIMEVMQGSQRAFLVNFQNISRTCERPWDSWNVKTVEFRLHEGTQSPLQVALYVKLCVAIVRAAERMAAKHTDYQGQPLNRAPNRSVGQVEGSKYVLQNLGPGNFGFLVECARLTLDDFFALLQLPEDERQYWRTRHDYFEQEEMETGLDWREDEDVTASSNNAPDGGQDGHDGHVGGSLRDSKEDDRDLYGDSAPEDVPEKQGPGQTGGSAGGDTVFDKDPEDDSEDDPDWEEKLQREWYPGGE